MRLGNDRRIDLAVRGRLGINYGITVLLSSWAAGHLGRLRRAGKRGRRGRYARAKAWITWMRRHGESLVL